MSDLEFTDQKILNKIISNIDLSNYSKKEFVAVIGPMGSGKTTLLKTKIIPKNKDKYYVSTDDYIDYMDKYGYTLYDLYKRSRNIGIKLTDILLEKNVSIVCEATGSNKDFITYLQKLKNNGFHIKSYLVSTPLEVCIDRVKQRNEISYRKVSIEAVKKAYASLWNDNLEDLKKVSDEYEIVKTNIGDLFNTRKIQKLKNNDYYSLQNFNFLKENNGINIHKADFTTIGNLIDVSKHNFFVDNPTKLYSITVTELDNGMCLEKPYFSTLDNDKEEDLKDIDIFIKGFELEVINDLNIHINYSKPIDIDNYLETIKFGFKKELFKNMAININKDQLLRFKHINKKSIGILILRYNYLNAKKGVNLINKPIKLFIKCLKCAKEI